MKTLIVGDIHGCWDEFQTLLDKAALGADDLLAFSRQQVIVPKVLDLNVVIANISRMLQRLIGDLALVTGRVDEAIRRQADAIEMNARIGARPFLALSRLGLAKALDEDFVLGEHADAGVLEGSAGGGCIGE